MQKTITLSLPPSTLLFICSITNILMVNNTPVIHIKMIIFIIYVFTIRHILNNLINKNNWNDCYVRLAVSRISKRVSNLLCDRLIFPSMECIDFLWHFHFGHLSFCHFKVYAKQMAVDKKWKERKIE